MMGFSRVWRALCAIGLAMCASVAFAGPVNVNTANAETLASELEGVGLTKARAIVAYRNAHGPFTTVESLTEVTGIGPRIVAQNRADILLSEPASTGGEDD